MSEILSSRHAALLEAMLRGQAIAQAAAELGMNERTARRWATSPAFQAELQRRTGDGLGDAARSLAMTMSSAVTVAAELMADKTAAPTVRLAAARLILDSGAALVEKAALVERLDRIEREISERRN
jgi:hypothetical protein